MPSKSPRRPPLSRRRWWRTVRLHDARHSAATTLLALGVPVRVVADLLGHSQTRVTHDTYQRVLPALAHDAADRMGAALWQ